MPDSADATPVIMRPLKPGYKATHLDPWPPAATKKPAAAQTATEAAAAERRKEEDGLKLQDGQN